MVSKVETSRNRAIFHARRRRAGETIASVVTYEVTYQCNLRCRHCYIGPYTHGKEEPGDELSTREVCDLLDQLFDSGTFYVDFTGGEVFCRRDIFEILEHAKKIGLFFGLKTNGTQITASIADRLKEVGISGVHVSIYGGTPESHEYITGIPGSLDKTINAVRLLREREIRVGINSTVMKCNADEPERIKELGKELGVKTSFTPIILPQVGHPGSADDFRMNDDQLRNLIITQNWVQDDDCRRLSNDELRVHILCSACRNRCAISPIGDVMPCVSWRRPLGNIRQQSFTDIWYGEPASNVRAIEINDYPICAKCEVAVYCARCQGMIELENENGGFSGPSSANCRMAYAIKEVRDANGKEAVH